jgi:1,4-alpha-glucan branching enzyme
MAGRWPHGEEWLHEAASETYIPLLDALYDLEEMGYPYKLTIGITPVLAEQLADQLVINHLKIYLEEKVEAARADIERFGREKEPHLEYLAKFHLSRYVHTMKSFEERFGMDIIGAFRKLQENGSVEVLTSAATHAYLPLLERDSSIYGQLRTGVESYKRLFGKEPRAVWLPECGYRPAFYLEINGNRCHKPGLEEFLAELGIRLFLSETHTIEGGRPVGKAAGGVIGPYGAIPKRYVVPIPDYEEPSVRTTFRPYYVAGADVAVIGRNNKTSMQVWSADWGYPGDYDYLEFHKKDGISGLKYWRVTGADVDLGYKDYYNPDWAKNKVVEHATHFAWLVEEQISDYYQESGDYGIIASCYDAELFGHWWFEGGDWLKEVLKILSRSEKVELVTVSEFVEEHPPEDVLALPEGSWGLGGGHWTWDNCDTHWMWGPIHEAERRMEELVSSHPSAQGVIACVLNQAARELMLLEASDWPFLVTSGQAREYATRRFNEHLERFSRLADMAEEGRTDEEARAFAFELYEKDKLFPNVDYRWFEEREKWISR